MSEQFQQEKEGGEKPVDGYTKKQEMLQRFRQHAVEGADEPAFPDIAIKVFEAYQAHLDHIKGENTPERRAAILRDTTDSVNEYMEEEYPTFRKMTEDEVRNMLAADFGIT